MNVHIRFGTLRDYFGLVNQANRKKKTKTLSGDFFTYADKEDHYWSGYYTSRPLLKQQDRLVEQYLRCAEILFSFWKLEERSNQLREDNFFEKLKISRQNLALFQHHDGITGTSASHVVKDYANK